MTAPSPQIADTFHRLIGVPPTSGNEVVVLRNGDEIFPAMLRAIDRARETIDIVTFVYWTGGIAEDFADRLGAAARRGCRVRVLLDAIGARDIEPELIEQMDAAGADVRWFREVEARNIPEIGDVNHRTHRKILVCDGAIAFTGGVGIAEEWTGDARDEHEWRDTHVSVRGPAVAGLHAAFLENWVDDADDRFDARAETALSPPRVGSSDCIVVRGSAESGTSDMRRLLLAMIQISDVRLRITSAYFNADDVMLDALCAAAERGVEVQLLFPGEHADKRFVQINGESDYGRLLDAGIDIRTYERTMLHAKVVTVDGAVATIGSANLNQRSMELDAECNLVVLDPDVVGVFDRHFDDDLQHTVELDPARWRRRPVTQKVKETMAGVAERWL